MQEREQRCGTCAHAHKYKEKPHYGSFLLAATAAAEGIPDSYVKIQCRRFPPVVTYVHGLGEDPVAAWPSMTDADWCGEWKRLDKAD